MKQKTVGNVYIKSYAKQGNLIRVEDGKSSQILVLSHKELKDLLEAITFVTQNKT